MDTFTFALMQGQTSSLHKAVEPIGQQELKIRFQMELHFNWKRGIDQPITDTTLANSPTKPISS